jgi:hypothetical protein
MKTLLCGLALCAAAIPALAQTHVSISIGQPGFYGRIVLGDFAPPPVVYAPQPVIVTGAPVYEVEPVYLRVPEYQRHHWRRYCGAYRACGMPVLFVRDDWYQNTYVPVYREHFHGPRVVYRDAPRVYDEGPRVVERVEYEHDHGRHEGWDHGGDHGEGHGHGHGHGHD